MAANYACHARRRTRDDAEDRWGGDSERSRHDGVSYTSHWWTNHTPTISYVEGEIEDEPRFRRTTSVPLCV